MIRRLLRRVGRKIRSVLGGAPPRESAPFPAPQRSAAPEPAPAASAKPAAPTKPAASAKPAAPTKPAAPKKPAGAPVRVVSSDTPNPNAYKFTAVGRKVVDKGSLSFGSAEEAAQHPLGKALFAIDGVANLFAVNDFVTITKSEEASWDALGPEIVGALERVLSAEG